MSAAAGLSVTTGICTILAGLLLVFGGLLVGLSYIFAIAVAPVLTRRDPIRSCRLFTEIDDQKRSYLFSVPLIACVGLALATIAVAAAESMWAVAVGATVFLCAVPLWTLIRLVPLNRAMADCAAVGEASAPSAADALRRWRNANVVRFWGGFSGLALVALGTGAAALHVP